MLTLERRLARNRLLSDVALGPDGGRAAILPDQSHPFFYDHPLDHVPGLLLIEAGFQMARAWARHADIAGDALCGFSVRFRRFCLHGAPIRLVLQSIAEGPVRTLGVALRQEGGGAADVTLRLGAPATGGDAVPHLPQALLPDPAPGVRLNKSDPANIMIGQPVETACGHAALLLPPAPGNLLGDGHPVWHHPLYLLEGFMQLLRFRNTERPAGAPRMRDILAGIDVDLAAPAARDTVATLHCAAGQTAAARFLRREGLVLADGRPAMRVSVLTNRPAVQLAPTNPASVPPGWTLPVAGVPVPAGAIAGFPSPRLQGEPA